MKEITQTSKAYFTLLSTIFTLLYAIQILFIVYTIYSTIYTIEFITSINTGNVQMWIIHLVLSLSLIGVLFLARKQILFVKKQLHIKEKTSSYFKAFLLINILFSIISLSSILMALITKHYIFFIYSFLILAYMLTHLPTRKNIIRNMDLNFDESALINDPNSKLTIIYSKY